MTDPAQRESAARARRSLRFWLLFGFAPFAIAMLVLSGKALTMYAFAHQAISAHVAGDPAGTVSAAAKQKPMNIFEPYLAPYNHGVGLATAGELAEARDEFEAALPLARGLAQCPVRIDLALTIEMQGDAVVATDPDAAARYYQEALEQNTAVPDACRTPEADEVSPDPSRSQDQTLSDQRDRLQHQQDPPPQQPQEEPDEGGGDDGGDDGDQSEQQSKLDEIEQKLRNGQSERENQVDDGDDAGTGTEKPG